MDLEVLCSSEALVPAASPCATRTMMIVVEI